MYFISSFVILVWPVLVIVVVHVVVVVGVAVIIVVGWLVATAVVIVDVCGSCLHLAAAAHVTANATQHTQHSTCQIQTRKTEASAMADGRRQKADKRNEQAAQSQSQAQAQAQPQAQAKTQAQSRAYCVRSRSRSRKV